MRDCLPPRPQKEEIEVTSGLVSTVCNWVFFADRLSAAAAALRNAELSLSTCPADSGGKVE